MIYMNYMYTYTLPQIWTNSYLYQTLLYSFESCKKNNIQNISSTQPFNHPTNQLPTESPQELWRDVHLDLHCPKRSDFVQSGPAWWVFIIQAQVFETPKITAWFIVSIRVIWKPHDLLQNPQKKVQWICGFQGFFFIFAENAMMSWIFWTNRLCQVDQVIRYFAVIFRLEPFQVSTNPGRKCKWRWETTFKGKIWVPLGWYPYNDQPLIYTLPQKSRGYLLGISHLISPIYTFQWWEKKHSKTSPTGPAEPTPKPEYLIALATYLGVRWKGPIEFLMETRPMTDPWDDGIFTY